MFKGNLKYIVILSLCFIALILLQILAPKPIKWNLSYLQKDDIPFGTSALNEALPAVFPAQTIATKYTPIYNVLFGNKICNCNYIIINQSFEPDKLDTRELLDFIYRGNTAFVAANYFGGKFADTLKLNTDNFSGSDNFMNVDSATVNTIYKPTDSSLINFVNPLLTNKLAYIYRKGFENTYFSSFDTTKTTILGNTFSNHINYIKLKFGKGNIYISSVPEAFANYHFVSEKNSEYVYKALSYLPIQQVIWDEYYKVGNIKQDNPLRVIFNNPALLSAYYLLMVSIIIFMAIGIKRKQRIIPVIEPVRNTTLQFVDIVGTLYYQTGNHKNIADKKITYFLDYIRSTFQVKTTIYDDVFIDRITNLSGIDKQKVHDLFYYFADISFKQTITQQELLKLNKMMEEFYNESVR